MEIDASGVVFTVGVLMIYVEFAFPKFAQLNPLGRWFNMSGPESSRITRIFGALCCLILALNEEGVFPVAYGKYVFPLIFIGAVTVIAHDLLFYWSRVPSGKDDNGVVPESKQSRKKRLK